MQPDYRDAADRHWEDADKLYNDYRVANADHLFGLSAECGLKAVMKGLGMSLKPDGKPEEPRHRVHINKLWDEFAAFSAGRGGARYAQAIATNRNPFINWDVGHRYCHRSTITPDVAEAHRQGAQMAMQVLRQAIMDGVVT